jgi:hypothetical protein
MPDRIVREGILESDAVNSLSWAGEVFYRRLINVVDDYGNFHGKPELILAKLYPLKLDRVSIADIGKWLTECVGAGLVSKYEIQGKAYVCIEKFDQKGLKRKVSKFPNKMLNAQVAEDVRLKRREEKRSRNEEEVEIEGEENSPPSAAEGHNVFLTKFFLPESSFDREQVCVQIRETQILEGWGAIFNAHLHTKGKWHHTYGQWLGHFTSWLPKALPDIKKQDSGQGKSKLEQALSVNQQAKEILRNGFGGKKQ